MIGISLPEICWRRLEKPRVIFLATCEKTQPKLRPVTLIGHEGRLFVHSYKETAKIKQIRKNPLVEFCMFLGNSTLSTQRYIRVRCNAYIVEDRALKATLLNQIDFIRCHNQSPDDPDFLLIELKPVGWSLT